MRRFNLEYATLAVAVAAVWVGFLILGDSRPAAAPAPIVVAAPPAPKPSPEPFTPNVTAAAAVVGGGAAAAPEAEGK